MPAIRTFLLFAVLAIGFAVHGQGAAQGRVVPAGAPNALFWDDAVAFFAVGEKNAPHVFTLKDAARCVGRWKLHVEEIDKWTFPDAAMGAFTGPLGYRNSKDAMEFFLVEDPDPLAAHAATEEAGRLLTQALSGDKKAARTYFQNLGLCSTKPEAALDEGPAEAAEEAAASMEPTEAVSEE